MLDRICAALSLGCMTAPPQRLHGGYTHRMFRIDTERGCFAVKLLSPEIMARPGVLDNYRAAEAFEALLEAHHLPILPARTVGGRKLHQLDGQYFYLFDYYDGRVLPDSALTPRHCARIGAALAQIHSLSRRERPADPPRAAPIDWPALTEALQSQPDAAEEAALLRNALPLLTALTAAADDAARLLPPVEALCHNDMDPKNVLWQGEAFRIIDLECLGYADPLQEMLDLAIAWAGCPPDESKFKAFIEAYASSGGQLPKDPAPLYDSRRNHIDWLAYNARRACFPDPEERRTARTQIRETLSKLRCDRCCRGTVIRWLRAGAAGGGF